MSGWTGPVVLVLVIFAVFGIAVYFTEASRDRAAAIVCVDHGGGISKGGTYGNAIHIFCADGTLYHYYDGEAY